MSVVLYINKNISLSTVSMILKNQNKKDDII